jgi:type IV pilus assembly protein PilQ
MTNKQIRIDSFLNFQSLRLYSVALVSALVFALATVSCTSAEKKSDVAGSENDAQLAAEDSQGDNVSQKAPENAIDPGTQELAADELGDSSSKAAPDLTITQKAPPPEPTKAVAHPMESKSAQQGFTGNFAEVSLSDIRYVAKKGGGTVVVETTAPATYQIREVPNQSQVVIELANTQLPAKLKRPFITKDFGQAITSINAYQDKGSSTVRIVVQMRSPNHAEVAQNGRELTLRAADQMAEVEFNSTLGGESAEQNPSAANAPNRPSRDVELSDEEVAAAGTPSAKGGASEAAVGSAVSSGIEGTDKDPRILPAMPPEQLASEDLKFYGKPISIEVRDTPVRDVISMIAEQSGTNIVLVGDSEGAGGGSGGTINLKLRQVPWDQALIIVLRARNLGYIRHGSVLRVAPFDALQKEAESARRVADAQKQAEPLKVKVLPVGYAKVTDLTERIRPFLTASRGNVVADARTNSLVVTDIAEVLQRVENLVKALDLPPLQVLIEGKVVEARESFARNVGVNWSMAGSPVGMGGTRTGTLSYNSKNNLPTSGGTFSVQMGTFDFFGDLSASIGLAESQDLVKVVSSPRIVALNNEPASILQGTKIGITQTTTNQGVVTQSVNYVPVDLKLDVTPQVTSENDVIMLIDIKRDFAGAIKQGVPAPNINNREAKTKVLVRNGQTAVIGGVYQADTDDLEEGTPWLKNIPVLGWLFKVKNTTNEKSEMLVFLTPRILNADTSLPKENNL